MKCPKCLFINPEGFKYCGNCGEPLLKTIEERKKLTVLFADLSGFTKISRDLDPEEVRELVNTYFEEFNKPISKYSGIIHKYEGDLIIAIFGVPESHEDDTERAILASLEMLNLIPTLNKKISTKLKREINFDLHIGINTGIVVTGEIGAKEKREWTIMGDTVNLTSRLKDVAKKGEIVVSEPVYRETRHIFEYEELPAVKPKGFDEEIKIYKVIKVKERKEKRRGIGGLSSKFVGRDKEMKFLVEKFEGLLSGKGGVIFILGEAGIGKTRLYEEFKKEIGKYNEKIEILEGNCLSYTEIIPYYPFLKILKTIFRVTEKDKVDEIKNKLTSMVEEMFKNESQNVLPYILHFFSISLEKYESKIKYLTPEILKFQTFESIKRLILNFSNTNKTIVTIDDFHWIDKLSLELFEFILSENSIKALIIAISRKDKKTYETIQKLKNNKHLEVFEISLEPLDKKSMIELFNNLLNFPDFPEDIKNKIITKSDGIPLYLEEIVKSLLEEKIIFFEERKWNFSPQIYNFNIPETIEKIVTSRFDKLDVNLKNTLQIASVFGMSFTAEIIENLCHPNGKNIKDYLEKLEEYELIKKIEKNGTPEYTFKNFIIREVVYNSILKSKRKELHERAANLIEKLYSEKLEEFYEAVADHYFIAENWAKAFEYSLKAAKKAQSKYLNQQAIMFYDRALICLESEELKEKIDEKIRIFIEKSDIYMTIGEFDKAIAEAQKGIDLSREINNKILEIESKISLCEVLSIHPSCGYENLLKIAKETLNLSKKAKYERGIGFSLGYIALAYQKLRNYKKSLHYNLKALKIFDRLGENILKANVLNNIGVLYAGLKKYDKVIKFYQKSLIILRELGDKLNEGITLLNIGINYLDLGQYHQSLRYLLKSLSILREVNYAIAEALALYRIGRLYKDTKKYKKSLKYFSEALEKFQEINDKNFEFRTLIDIGNIFTKIKKFDEAENYLKLAEEISKNLRSDEDLIEMHLAFAELFIERKEKNDALDHIQKAIELAEKIKSDTLFAKSLLIKSKLELLEKKESKSLIKSIEIIKKLNDPFSKARLYLEIYEILESVGDSVGAKKFFKKAEKILNKYRVKTN